MNILMITPMLKEFHCAREIFSAVEMHFEDSFRLACRETRQHHIYILQCGYHLTKSLELFRREIGKPHIIVDSGSCGSLSHNFDLGQILGISKVINESNDVLYYDLKKPLEIDTASLIEVSAPVISDSDRSRFCGLADLISMESYSLCRYAVEEGLDHYGFRVVTDYADSSFKGDFKRNFRPACTKLYRYIFKFLNDLSH